MKNIRQVFAQELARAMERMGYEPRASVLERQFNLRYQGEPVTYHGVRRWLQGETLPTADKLQLLAGWLGLGVDPFMAALQGGTEEAESRYRFSDADHEVFQTYLCLTQEQREAVARMIFLLARCKG
ncbi:MAG: transcriptional regulator [Gammaproteobacteria bacterium]|nr:transcriptional regulator [Gammaproteobacteria bacterium]